MERSRTPSAEIRLVTSSNLGTRHEVLGLVHAATTSINIRLAFAQALNEIRTQAHSLGADAVVDLVVSQSQENSNYAGCSVIIMGTAVLLPWPAGHGNPELHLGNPEK